MTVQSTMMRPPPQRPGWQTPVGLILVLPALVLLVTGYVMPLIWTIDTSFHRVSLVRLGGEQQSVGGDNYRSAYDAGLAGATWYALSLAVIPLLLVLLLAPALAAAAHGGGTWTRWVVRAVLAVPVAGYVPVAIAAGLRTQYPDAQRLAYWLGTFGVVVALATLTYLAALRRRTLDSTRSPWPAALVVAGLAVITVIALALQEFTFPFVTGFGRTGETPARLMYEVTFRTANYGVGAAISVTVLVPLILLGVAATVLVALSGARLEVDPARPATPPRSPLAVIAAGVLLLLTLAVVVTGLAPWLARITAEDRYAGSTWVNTWLPPAVSALVGVTVAALAAFGISGLRPLGRRSEWLLLPFGLFLFVGSAPLALRQSAAGQTADRLNTFAGLIPPTYVTIPALFILALLFRGQAERREILFQEGRPTPFWSLLLPALPMLALAYVATWLVQAQDLIWPLISATGDHATAQYVILRSLTLDASGAAGLSRLMPIWLLVLLILGTIAAQLLYLDRVALRVGLPERDHPPRT